MKINMSALVEIFKNEDILYLYKIVLVNTSTINIRYYWIYEFEIILL